jgi:SAM-dependent methyltransferase
MKPLYLTEPVQKGLGGWLRPGGEYLTRRAIDYLQPAVDTVALDAGCGAGATLGTLRQAGISRLAGVDINFGFLRSAKRCSVPVLQSDLAGLPFAAGSFDLIFCECVWNLTEKSLALDEFSRVLRPGGTLVLSDIYLRTKGEGDRRAWPIRSCFSQATDLQTVCDEVTAARFEIELVEDHAKLLKQTAAEFVFRHGSLQAFWQAVTGDEQLAACGCDVAANTRPSLFLLIARRFI